MAPKNIRYLTLDQAIYDQQAPFDPDDFTPQTAVNPVNNQGGFPKSPGDLPPHPNTPGYRYDSTPPEGPKQSLSQSAAPRRRRPIFNDFEPPKWEPIVLHILLCIIAYPLLMICVVALKDRTLWWTRCIVGLGCSVIGAGLSLRILALGKPYLEAATWATVVHQSRAKENAGIKLKDLAAQSFDAGSSMAALKLLWDRAAYSGTARPARKEYDARPWTLFILFFLFMLALAASVPFTLGRLVNITATLTQQTIDWQEGVIYGVSSADDIGKAQNLSGPINNMALTWTLSPFSHRYSSPPVASFNWENDTVYFSETTSSQLQDDGHGFGTFDIAPFNSSAQTPLKTTTTQARDALEPIDPGYLLRYPKWGTRLHCVNLPDPDINLIPRSNSGRTYLLIPRQTIRDLFTSFNREFNETKYPTLTAANITKANINDTLPAGLNPADIALSAAFYDNGVAVSYFSDPYSMGRDGQGWTSVELVLVRLNTTYAPNAKFARLSDMSVPVNGVPTYIGYDAAACLQLFEPWIVETYNGTTGTPSARRLIGLGNVVRDWDDKDVQERQHGKSVTDPDAIRELNSTNLIDVYNVAHENGIHSLVKDNGRDNYYVPSQTLVSFSGGQGPNGFTQLSPELFARFRGSADAINILPYFAGSGKLVVRIYKDKVLASASILTIWTIAYLGSVLGVGLIAGLFVPKLPLNAPRRGFQLYSWLAMFYADELVAAESGAIGRNMELEDIERHLGDLRFRYVNPRVARYDVSPS